jgi:hypothetical protein
MPIFREMRDIYFSGPTPPAVTTLTAAGLVRVGALVEVGRSPFSLGTKATNVRVAGCTT